MNKLFVLVAFCLINASLAARLPRSAESKDSSSSEEDFDFPKLFNLVIGNIATAKNISLSESQKESAVAILSKDHKDDNTSDSGEITLKDIEKLKTELSAVLPSEITEEISTTLSKFTKGATSDETIEGFIRLFLLAAEGSSKTLDDAIAAEKAAETKA